MVAVAAVVLGLAGFLYLFFRVVLWYASAVAKRLVERTHRDTEHVLTTGRIPTGWVNAAPDRPDVEPGAARRVAIRRLRSLIGRMQRTTLVDSEATRATVVEKLSSTEERWKSAPWSDIGPE